MHGQQNIKKKKNEDSRLLVLFQIPFRNSRPYLYSILLNVSLSSISGLKKWSFPFKRSFLIFPIHAERSSRLIFRDFVTLTPQQIFTFSR